MKRKDKPSYRVTATNGFERVTEYSHTKMGMEYKAVSLLRRAYGRFRFYQRDERTGKWNQVAIEGFSVNALS